jgi:dipeptidyl aminopeptidase/acylaminoacyl peptidase
MRWQRILRAAVLASLISAVIILGIGWGLAWQYATLVLHPGCQGNRASLEQAGFPAEPVEFASRNGPTLRGWFSPGDKYPDIAIIVMTGHGGNTSFTLPDAEILARSGFSTLIFEHRSCADPALSASTGYFESFDLLGAVDYLRSRPDVHHIGALGFSEGGTASLLAAADEPALEAVVAMGGYDSLERDIRDSDRNLSLMEKGIRQMIIWSIELQLRVTISASSPVDVINRISPHPLLLIYGEHELPPGQNLFDAAGEPKELWVVPGAGHGGYSDAAPEEYPRRIVEFFMAAFSLTH